ncbi:MAG: energy-coupling factor ABC transporter ATP-binding protein [Treponema sp.]|jgi:energy-coupling factor transport system ATP-binding protein|nr:energy-coupling factor ABC transporter ATP-binding protein [Treponema sp.]
MAALIELRNVSYTYPLAGRPAIRNMSFALEAGGFYGIMGENGSGKTSLCALIRGFAPAYYRGELEGEVLIDGRPTTDYGPGELSLRTGYVFQNPFTQISGVKNTVFEEVAFGLENFGVPPGEIEERITAVMETTGITALAEKNPFELSGGQQQRLALASVIVLKPDILVIDEPTSQLDPEGAESVFAIIRKMKEEKKTIVLAEHKADLLAEFADTVLVLREGGLVRMGPPSEVLADMSLAETGAPLPQAALLGAELVRRGLPLGRIPVTADALAAALENR